MILRDLFWTLVVLGALLLLLLALPVFLILLTVGGTAFVVYAIIHDTRIARQQAEESELDRLLQHTKDD